MKKRIFILVLDSLGIGELPDADRFGDKGSHTLKSISSSSHFHIPNLILSGLGNVDGISFLPKEENPLASFGRMAQVSQGKDTTIGHWELAGIHSRFPLPTYPNGFPTEIIEEFEKQTGRGVLCNKPFSGTEVIRLFGKEHEETGNLIVYTSQDSVFQIAAHEKKVPVDKLYEYCRIARKILKGEHAVGRVIARPFVTENGAYVRTANRRDFSLEPPEKTLLDAARDAGFEVVSIGKIKDIFAYRGITKAIPTASNAEGMERILSVMQENFEGICFANLVDFDSLFGHRNDSDGYAAALSEFDRFLPTLLDNLKKGDLLFITADHGCDPGTPSTDHSREYVPVLMFGHPEKKTNLGTRTSFSDLAVTCAKYLNLNVSFPGNSFFDR